MKTILDAYPSHKAVGEIIEGIETKDGSYQRITSWPTPAVHVLGGTLASARNPQPRQGILISALLDTGSDITLVSKKSLRKLEKDCKIDLHTRRAILVWGKFRPVYSYLVLVLPGEHECKSPIGFVEASDDEFGHILNASEMLMGQDVLNKLVVTFDGPNGTVTICEP